MKAINTFRKLFLLVLLIGVGLSARGSTLIDGLYYNLDTSTKTAKVTYKGYNQASNKDYVSGALTIPSTVTSEGVTYDVTDIDDRAFMYCEGLTSLTLPSSIKSMGVNMLQGTKVTTLNIPANVTTCTNPGGENITTYTVSPGNTSYLADDGVVYTADHNKLIAYPAGKTDASYTVNSATGRLQPYSFANAKNLKSITLDDKLAMVFDYAFSNCSGLTSLRLPAKVNTFSTLSCTTCDNLQSIEVDPANSYFKSIDGVLYSADGKKLCIYPKAKTGDCYTVQQGTELLYRYCLYGNKYLKQIILPSTVKEIDLFAITDMTLDIVAFPTTVPTIGTNSIRNTTITRLIVPAEAKDAYSGATFWNSAKSIVAMASLNYAYNYSSKHTGEAQVTGTSTTDATLIAVPPAVEYGGKTYPVTAVKGNAFQNNDKIEEVILPSTLREIGQLAFYVDSKLKSINLPEGLKFIDDEAFGYCSALTSLTFPSTLDSLYASSFDGTGWYNAQPDGVVYANRVLYRYKGNMPANTRIDIKEGTVSTAVGAFQGQVDLTGITLPASLRLLSDLTFASCLGLTEITIPGSVNRIGWKVFRSSGLKTIYELSSIVPATDDEVLTGTTDVTLYVPKGTKAAYAANTGWSKAGTIIEGTNTLKYTYNADGTATVFGNGDVITGTLVIPQTVVNPGDGKTYTVTVVGTDGFESQEKIENVILPPTIKELRTEAFYQNTALKSINLPEGLKYLGDGALMSCPLLTSLTFPSTLDSLQSDALNENGWYNAQPDGLIYINHVVVCYKGTMPANTKLTIAEGTTATSDFTFEGMTNLTGITLPTSLRRLSDGTFINCSGLTEVTIPATVTRVGERVFYNSGVKTIHIFATTVPATSDNVLNGTTGVTLYVPKGTKAAYAADAGWSKAGTILEDGYTLTYSYDAGTGLAAVTGATGTPEGIIEIPSSVINPEDGKSYTVAYLDDNAFQGQTKITGIHLPSTLLTLRQHCLDGTSITSLTIPEGVVSIEEFALDIPKLETLSLPTTLTYMDTEGIAETSWFQGDGGGIYNNGNFLGYSNTPAPSNLVIKSGTRLIAAFSCEAFSTLKSVTVPEGVKYINKEAFYNCRNLKEVHLPSSIIEISQDAFGKDTLRAVYTTALTPPKAAGMCNFGSIDTLYVPAGTKAAYAGAYGWKVAKVIIEGSAYTLKYTYYGDGTASVDGTSDIITGTLTIPQTVVNPGNGKTYTVTAVGTDGFDSQDKIENVVLPSTIKILHTEAFSNCTALKSINLPEGLKYMDDGALLNCTALTSLTFPSTLDSLIYCAFDGSGWYKAQPDGLIYINHVVLCYKGDMPANTKLTIAEGTIATSDWTFNTQSNLTGITLPASLRRLSDGTFRHCSGLTEVTIPAGVTRVGADVFEASGVKTIHLLATTVPATSDNVLNGTTGVTLYVPKGTKAAYAANTGWSKAATIIEEGGTTVKKGDANGDEVVNAQDVVSVFSYILSGTTDDFSKQAADVNGDGTINAQDIVEISSIILGSGSKSYASKGYKASTTASLSIPAFEIKPGEQKEIEIDLDNPGDLTFTSYQYDLFLPAGFKFVYSEEDEDYMVAGTSRLPKNYTIGWAIQKSGAMRVLYYHSKLKTITGESGAITTMTIQAPADAKVGTFTIKLDTVVLVRTDKSAEKAFSKAFTFKVVSADGIDGIQNDASRDIYYDLQGRRVLRPEKGLYIRNGRKVVVKKAMR